MSYLFIIAELKMRLIRKIMSSRNNGLVPGKKFLVGASGGRILYSLNGSDFINTNAAIASNYEVTKIIKGGNKYYASLGNSVILTSDDGVTWDAGVNAGFASIRSMVVVGEYIYAVGDSGIYRANIANLADGNWTRVFTTPYATTYYDIVYGAGLFVAVGSGGRISTSSDGVNWIARTSGISVNIFSIAYGSGGNGNKYFMAAAGSGNIIHSTDGITWNNAQYGYGLGSQEVYAIANHTEINGIGSFGIGTWTGTIGRVTEPSAYTNNTSQTGSINDIVFDGNGIMYAAIANNLVIFNKLDSVSVLPNKLLGSTNNTALFYG